MPALVCGNRFPMAERPLSGSFENGKEKRLSSMQGNVSPQSAQHQRWNSQGSAQGSFPYSAHLSEDLQSPTGAPSLFYGDSGAPYLHPISRSPYLSRYTPYETQLVQPNVSNQDDFLPNTSRYRDNVMRHGPHGGFSFPHEEPSIRRPEFSGYRQMPGMQQWQGDYGYEGYSGIGTMNTHQSFRQPHYSGLPDFRSGFYDEGPPMYGSTYVRDYDQLSTDFVPYNSNFSGLLGHPKSPSIQEKVEEQIGKLTSRRPKRARRANYEIEPAYGGLNPSFSRSTYSDASSKGSISSNSKSGAANTSKEVPSSSPSFSSSTAKESSTFGSADQSKQSAEQRDLRVEEDPQSTISRITETEDEAKQKRNPLATSRYRGVSWNKANQSWKACIKVKGKNIHIGYFEDDIDAAKAYDIVAQQYRGDRAKVNFPESRIAFATTLQGFR